MPQSTPTRINWPTTLFLTLTPLAALIAVPAYIINYGLDWFQIALFFAFYYGCGMSITLGYHRLFSHLAFKAKLPVRLGVLAFGAAAFEGSVLDWVSDHRRHHKHVDHEEDPYNINKGFIWAHLGWLVKKLDPKPPMDNVNDLKRDKLVMFQHRYWPLIGVLVGLGLPALLGYFWNGGAGALGGFLLAGLARIVLVQHCTFFINSLCHTLGRRPYSSETSARDSAIMAVLTFGEGYHNYHHHFQHDYRNGVKPWQVDPTKWAIWVFSKFGLTSNLRRIAPERIQLAEIAEKEKQFQKRLETRSDSFCEATQHLFDKAQEGLQQAAQAWEQRSKDYMKASRETMEASKERLTELKKELEVAAGNLRDAINNWHETHQLALTKFA